MNSDNLEHWVGWGLIVVSLLVTGAICLRAIDTYTPKEDQS